MYFYHKENHTNVASLSIEEIAILKNPTFEESFLKSKLIEKLIHLKKEAWIFCDCQGESPLLVIYNKNGHLYIRLKQDSQHKSHCAFLKPKRISHIENSSFFLPSKKTIKYVLYTRNEKLSPSIGGKQGHSSAFTKNKLGALLYEFLTENKLNSRHPYLEDKAFKETRKKPTLSDQLRLISQKCESKIIFKDVSLNQYLNIYLTEKTKDNARAYLNRRALYWPERAEPFYLFLSVGLIIEGDVFEPLYTSRKDNERDAPFRINVKNSISLPSTWINPKQSNPFLVLTSAKLDNNKELYFADAFAMPILTENELIPLESNYERTVLRKILGTVRQFPNLSIEIEKPLFCLVSEDNERYRPDFIISLPENRKIMVEVLGSSNEEYIKHKTDMKNIALSHSPYYLSVSPYKNTAGKEITDFTSELKHLIEKISQ